MGKTTSLHRPAGPKECAKSAFHATEGATIGDFRLVRLLGRGGMGEVWEAEQLSLSRRVALKLLLPERVDTRGLEFFAREARAGGKLSHPGIVAVYGTGETEGLHWIAMELVEDSCDLRRSLDGHAEGDELDPGYHRHVAEFLAELADAAGDLDDLPGKDEFLAAAKALSAILAERPTGFEHKFK